MATVNTKTDLHNVVTVRMLSRSINTIDSIQHKNLISSLIRLTIEKSKKTVHLEKEERLLKFPICLLH